MRRRVMSLLPLLALLLAAAVVHPVAACTSFIVGSAASVDGSVLIARNDDGEGAVSPSSLVYHPAREGPALLRANLNNLTLTLPAPGFAYWALPAGPLADADKGTNTTGEAAGWNEAGVAVSATESIYNSAAALAADPPNEDTGIIEDVIPSILLPQATSARHGAKLLGEAVSKHGAGEAFGVLIADREEVWYLETASGHHWLAQRVPPDTFFVSANQGRFQEVDLDDEAATLSSPGLLKHAIRSGLWDPASGRPFNFFSAFMRDGVHDTNYSYPRVCLLQGMWGHFCGQELRSPALGCRNVVPKPCDNMLRQPVFLKPQPRKLSAQDVMAAMRNHFEGSRHDPYTLQHPEEPFRPIALLRTGMGHVTRLRPLAGGVPDGLSIITYTAMSTPKLSPFIPLYKGLPGDVLPPELTAAEYRKPDRVSLFWKARRLQALVFQDWPALAPAAAQAIVDWEAKVEAQDRPAMEARYTAAWQAGDAAGATQELVSFTSAALQEAGQLLEGLAEAAAWQLGLPGMPSDDWLLERLEEAAEMYAFEPTSDDPPPPSCHHRHHPRRRGDKRPRPCADDSEGEGGSASRSSYEAAGASVLEALHEAATE
ncbi:hypothetical protein ABPG75_009621 [Micractinium tetrahymenae]